VHTIDSALIVIGGGLAQSGASLLDPVAAVLRDRCRPRRDPPPVELSGHGELGVVTGAHRGALAVARAAALAGDAGPG